ncbi:sensor histidine kinase [Rosettibacter firmus]|uniref:sensor histidine kinase n=1 Tax=Rosettibacter firmus TaxID=3111522 RepID=UPI00336C260E
MEKSKKNSLIETKGTIHDENLFPHRHVSKEKLFKIIAEFSTDWIYWLDPHNKITYMSPSCRYITGYSKEEFLKDRSLLIKIVDKTDLEKFINHTREILKGKIFCSFEFMIVTKNGEKRFISHTCQAVYDDNNKYIGRYISNRDITEIKNAWEKLDEKNKMLTNIYNDASIGTYQIYPDGKLRFANDVFIKMLGYNNLDELKKLNFEKDIFQNEEDRNYLKKILLHKNRIKNLESTCKKKDGTRIYIIEQITPVKDDNGRIIYYESMVQNITDKKKTKELLIEAETKKQTLEKLKAEFLATISHEIRTPVNIIVNLSQLLKNDLNSTNNEEVIESAHIIESESKRIQRTIDLILEIAQLTSGTYDFKPQPINLHNDILLDIIEKYKQVANKKGLDFLYTSKINRPLTFADKHSCQQIFSQLIENAIKYTPEGRIEITLFNNSTENIAVEIKDTGIGINTEYIPYLFTIFSQEDNSYSRMFEGTGLGLAIVKKHCDLNNASINVVSKKGYGSSFTVIFKKYND